MSKGRAPSNRLETFDVLRLLAASLVIFDHSRLIASGREYVPLLWHDYGWSWGRVAIAIFFAISGFLITSSWMADPSPERFAVRRAARIWPSLVVVVVLATVVLGPLVTSLSTSRYFASATTWEYAVRGLLVVPVGQRLPGVFDTRLTSQVNSPLWTLAVELACYAVVAVIGYTQLRKGRACVVPVCAVLLALLSWHEIIPSSIPGGILARTQLIAIFLFASTIAVYRDRLPLKWPIAVVVLAALVASTLGPLSIVATFTVPYLVVFAGTRDFAPARHYGDAGDPSYGIYVYGWPIQQLLVGLAPFRKPAWMFVGSLSISIAVGYTSWHLIEKRVLRRARVWLANSRFRPEPQTVVDPKIRVTTSPFPSRNR